MLIAKNYKELSPCDHPFERNNLLLQCEHNFENIATSTPSVTQLKLHSRFTYDIHFYFSFALTVFAVSG